MAAYAARWLETIRPPAVAPPTWSSYADNLRLHVLPTLGARPLEAVRRSDVRGLLAAKLAAGLSRNSVRLVHATLRVMLNAAIDDERLGANPAAGVGRRLGLERIPADHKRLGDGPDALVDVRLGRAMSRAQLGLFLDAARRAPAPRYRRLWPLFLLLARSGLRIGEALALRWEDLHFSDGVITVVRACSWDRVDGKRVRRLVVPKRVSARQVDMSQQLALELRRLRQGRQQETRERGWPAMPPWVFCSTTGTPLDYALVRRAFTAARDRALGSRHWTLHCLRHTFSAHLLTQGESPVYVQRQLGHKSIKLTVDLYGCWLPMRNRAAVDRLDDWPRRRGQRGRVVRRAKGGT
ncbi:MAG: tyrosine-type recombinase/integrase [Candidatus Rokuibacteriota bacterium]